MKKCQGRGPGEKADYVLHYISLDRPHMKLPQSQENLLNAVAEVNKNAITIMTAGFFVKMH